MRMLYLKNMVSVSVISLVFSSGVIISSLTFSAIAIAKMKKQDVEAPTSNVTISMDRIASVQNRLLNLLEAREEYPTDTNRNFLKAAPEAVIGNRVKQEVKGTTANVKKRLMRLVRGSEGHNPPNSSYGSPQMGLESDMLDESRIFNLDEPSISEAEMPEAEQDSHVNETAFRERSRKALTTMPVSYFGSPSTIRPNLIAEEEGEYNESNHPPKGAKPTPNPYDPTNEGTSKGGRDKGPHLHSKSASVHNIPIIRMGENYEESGGLTIIKPWNN